MASDKGKKSRELTDKERQTFEELVATIETPEIKKLNRKIGHDENFKSLSSAIAWVVTGAMVLVGTLILGIVLLASRAFDGSAVVGTLIAGAGFVISLGMGDLALRHWRGYRSYMQRCVESGVKTHRDKGPWRHV